MNYKDVYRQIMLQYDKNKQNAEYIKKERLEKIYEKIPEIKLIDEKINELGILTTKSILYNSSDAQDLINKLKKESLNLQEKRKYILKENNIEEDFLKNVYTCNLCKDTGYIENKKCSCLKQNIINKYYDLSNLKNILEEENFDNFNFEYFSNKKLKDSFSSPRENIEKIYKICTDFTNKFNNIFENLLFYGHAGRGKTFLCNCIAKDILDKGYPVLYISAGDLFNTIETLKFNSDNTLNFTEQMDIFYSVDLLIIDDLGTEFSTSVTQSSFFNIINSRLLKKLSTIISTNLSPSDIQNKYSDRITSRLVGKYKLIKFFGDDIRCLKKYSMEKYY